MSKHNEYKAMSQGNVRSATQTAIVRAFQDGNKPFSPQGLCKMLFGKVKVLPLPKFFQETRSGKILIQIKIEGKPKTVGNLGHSQGQGGNRAWQLLQYLVSLAPPPQKQDFGNFPILDLSLYFSFKKSKSSQRPYLASTHDKQTTSSTILSTTLLC